MNTYNKSIFSLILCLGWSLLSFAQDCVPGTGEDSELEGGKVIISYGASTNSVTPKETSNILLGQSMIGQNNTTKFIADYGFYSQFLLPPLPPTVRASQGELLDRIQVSWALDPLGSAPNEGFNLFRDGVFIDYVGPKVTNYNDFNVIAGRPYTYTVSGINEFGEGSTGSGLGFQVPNGVVTGWVSTLNSRPVPNAQVTLLPMQGYSANFGTEDGAVAIKDMDHPFLPTLGNDWTITFWMKTTASTSNADVISFNGSTLEISALLGADGISVTQGSNNLTANFGSSEWHHIALAFESAESTGRLYIDGALKHQSTMGNVASPDSIYFGKVLGSSGWNGKLDEFRIYHTLLDELDLGMVMEGTASSTTPFLSHYWKFDEELGEKSFDIINRHQLYFCGAQFDPDRPPVRTAGLTDEEGYYLIEGVSYGTGTTFIAKPEKNFYLHRSLEFKSSESDYVSLPDFALPQKFTLEVWVNNTNAGPPQTILSKKEGSNSFKVYSELSGSSNELKINININGTVKSFGNLQTGFNHLAFTIDSTAGQIQGYINGGSPNTQSFTIPSNWSDTAYHWYIGADSDGNALSGHFNGLIDEVAVYDTLLTHSAILAHAQNARVMPEDGLVVYFPMDEGNGNRVTNVGSKLLEFGSIQGAVWSNFAANQETTPHEFAPKTRQVTLNPSVTSVDQVDFVDNSTVPVVGYVRYKNTDCFANNVEILINNTRFNPPIFTDSTGRFVIDFDPGTTARLTPKFEDHVFVPAFWDVTNVNSPIAGIVFNDVTTREVSGIVAGGSNPTCKKSIMREPVGDADNQGTVCLVQVRSVDGCFVRTIKIDNVEGEYEFNDLPPLEKMTVAVIEHSDDDIRTSFQVQGGSTVDLTKKDTIIDFIYVAPPVPEITSGLDPFPGCSPEVIVIDKGENITVNIRLKEVYAGGACYLDTASFNIINGFSDTTQDTVMSGGNLQYTFKVGSPNPSPPYLKTLQIIGTSEAGRKGSLVEQAIITGTKEKLPSFTTKLPERPFLVLHDPPGDGSYAFLEKDSSVCYTTGIKLTVDNSSSAGANFNVLPKITTDVGFIFSIQTELRPILGGTINLETTYSKTSDSTFQTCLQTTQRISTDDGDLIVGGERGGDLFMGAAQNIIFANVDEVTFDNCTVNVVESVEVSPGAFATTFIYSEFNIRNYVIPNLTKLLTNPNTTPADSINQSIARWQKILSDNDARKSTAETLKNISFDAGVSYEYSETVIKSQSSTLESDTMKIDEGSVLFGFFINDIGAVQNLDFSTTYNQGQTTESNSESGNTIGYVLKDDDPGDFFSIDIGTDSAYLTPTFKLRAGQSSCPWEPGSANREEPNLQIAPSADTTSAFTAINVPSNESAVFKMFLGNESATNEDWTYGFTAIAGSNPDGAIIKLNGQPLNNNTIQYIVPFGTSIPITLTVDRGPIAYEYKDLQVALVSECEMARNFALSLPLDNDEKFFSAINLGVDFIRPCSEVKINVPEQNWVVINNDPIQPGTKRGITVSGYDMNSPDFQLIRLQYRRSDGNGAWINLPTPPNLSHEAYNPKWSGFNTIPNSPDTMLLQPNFTQFVWETAGIEDGNYEFHAWAVCSGDASEKPGFSDIIKGKIDRQPPALLGIPQPSDGVYHVGDEISFTFNQNINCNKIIDIDDVGLYDATTNQLIDFHKSCKDNKIIIEPLFQNEFFENKILRAELDSIQDLVGNTTGNLIWEFYVDRNELAWLTDSIELTKYDDQTKTITAKIHNRGGYPVPYTIQSIPDWVHVSPNAGTLVANEIEEIHFTVDETVPLGWLSDSIIMHTETGLNPFFMGGDEVLNMAARVICRPDKWIINPEGFDPSGYSFSMNFTLEMNIEGVTSVDKQDLVGAYVNGQLRGVARLQYNPELDNYLAFLTAYSNVASGELVEFQIWDASECKLFALILESFTFNADQIIGSPLMPQVIHTDSKVLRKIFIHPGWNWLSMNLDQVDPAINDAMSSLTNPGGGFIKSQDSLSGYSLIQQLWIGTLNTISPLDMYQYNSLAYDSLSIVGTLLDPSTPIPVVSGWNWIGYIPNEKLPIAEALSSLTPTDGDIVKSQISFAQYVAGFGWIGNLKFFDAPNGYLLKLANPDTIIYPDPQNFRGQNVSGNRYTPPGNSGMTMVDNKEAGAMPYSYWQVDPTKYEHNMNVIAIVKTHESNSNILKDGDEVGAFVDGEVRGSSQVTYIPSMDAYMIFMTAYANKEGELLTFKFYDASENKVFEIEENTGFVINSILGEVDNPEPLHLSMASGISYEEGEIGKMSVYPNPFASSVFVKYYAGSAGEDQLVITDVLSRVVTKMDVQVKQGINIVEWKPNSDVQPGTYFFTLKNETESQMQKVLYIK